MQLAVYISWYIDGNDNVVNKRWKWKWLNKTIIFERKSNEYDKRKIEKRSPQVLR